MIHLKFVLLSCYRGTVLGIVNCQILQQICSYFHHSCRIWRCFNVCYFNWKCTICVFTQAIPISSNLYHYDCFSVVTPKNLFTCYGDTSLGDQFDVAYGFLLKCAVWKLMEVVEKCLVLVDINEWIARVRFKHFTTIHRIQWIAQGHPWLCV